MAENCVIGNSPNDLRVAVMAMISHDLRQPLQVVTSSHDLLVKPVANAT